MEFNEIELLNKDSKGENLIGSAGNFDESEIKKRKKIRIIIIISVILVVSIISLVLYFCLRSRCNLGENERCLSCQKNSNKCASCNPYFRLENGKCIFIYSFEAIYNIHNDINKYI